MKTLPNRLLVSKPAVSEAVLQVVDRDDSNLPNLLQNAGFLTDGEGKVTGWQPFSKGFEPALQAGPQAQNAVTMKRAPGGAPLGISQTIQLNQRSPQTISVSGQAKAQGIFSTGGEESDFSLYLDIFYQDGTAEYGVTHPFGMGTYQWQKVRFQYVPDKPIRSVTLSALLRGQYFGQAWFADLALKQFPAGDGVRFDNVAVKNLRAIAPAQAREFATADGLTIQADPNSGTATSVLLGGKTYIASQALTGFVARDVANDTAYYPLASDRFDALKLDFTKEIKADARAITISGRVQDRSGGDRAVSLAYAIPFDATDWQWGDDTSTARTIVAGREYSNTATVHVGSNGRMSSYPLAAVWNGSEGLAICLDMNQAAQFRVAYNAGLKCLYIVYDVGMTPEKPAADFQFVVYRFDGRWGYRAAVAKMYELFPPLFEVRDAARKQGLWMPFTRIEDVQGWQDFGFRFREAWYNERIAWDDAHDILTFRYWEPATWWMALPGDTPRTYENALAEATRLLGKNGLDGQKAAALLHSGMRRADGTLAMRLIDVPWKKGAVWNLNTLPGLRGERTGASLIWNDLHRSHLASKEPYGELDGEYLDSMEGFAVDNMDYERSHFAAATAPLSFDSETYRPGIYKGLMNYELARHMSRELHAMGKYLFANSTPRRVCFLPPWFDALGTETNWLGGGRYSPPSDRSMNLMRSMAGQKAYCLLQNTNMEAFGPHVEKYFQRSLFYGMFPGFFSADASTNPYWENPAWYNRDRALFKKYIPLVQELAAAGWRPVTLVQSDNPQVRLERFGGSSANVAVSAPLLESAQGKLYLTVLNMSNQPQTARLTLDRSIQPDMQIKDAISGEIVTLQNNVLTLSLNANQVMMLQLF